MFETLTDAQRKVMARSTTGEASKEIADELFLTENTVNTHLKNIKDKVKERTGKSYKLAELRFHFLCETIGEHSEDIKKAIIASTLSLIMLYTYTASFDNDESRRRYRVRRREQPEYVGVNNDII